MSGSTGGEAAHFVNLRPAGKADGRGAKKEPAGHRLRTFTGLSRGAPPTLQSPSIRKQDSEVFHPPLPALFNQTHLQKKHKERHELTEAAHLPGYELC